MFVQIRLFRRFIGLVICTKRFIAIALRVAKRRSIRAITAVTFHSAQVQKWHTSRYAYRSRKRTDRSTSRNRCSRFYGISHGRLCGNRVFRPRICNISCCGLCVHYTAGHVNNHNAALAHHQEHLTATYVFYVVIFSCFPSFQNAMPECSPRSGKSTISGRFISCSTAHAIFHSAATR